MIDNFIRISIPIVFTVALVLSCSSGNVQNNSDAGQDAGDDNDNEVSGRDADPVVLTGDNIALLIGRDPSRLVAYRYQNGWERVPVQVDERVVVDLALVYGFDGLRTRCLAPKVTLAPCYADPKTFTGPDTDPSIDADDEVVFMYSDSGKRPADFREPTGVTGGSGIEVTLSNTQADQRPRYLYLFNNDGSLEPEADRKYGQYSFQLINGDYPMDYRFCDGRNPEDSWFKSDTYQRHFTDRWLSDVIKILAPGASGVDIMDAQYVTITGLGTCSSDSGAFAIQEGAIATIKSGPVRSIYSFLGAQSAAFMQRTHVFYQKREDIVDNLRVHALGADTRIQDGFDYSKEAVGMKYYDADNRQGLTIDGMPDDFKYPSIPIANDSYEKMWSLVTGPQGSMVTVVKSNTDIAALEFQRFYRDETPATDTPCQGDDSYYGISGMILGGVPCVETFCENDFESVRTLYYSVPGMTVDDATALAKNVYTPIHVELAARGTSQTETDTGDSGQMGSDSAEAFHIDPNRVLCEQVISIDKQTDGKPDERWTLSVDHSGYQNTEQWDKNADGVADARWTVIYQNRDTVVTEEWDDGANGAIDARRINHYECYAEGVILPFWKCDLVESETDNNADGAIDEVWSLAFQNGNLVEEKWDQDGDGVVDQRWEAEWESDETGTIQRLARVSWDSDGDERMDQTITQEFNQDGNLSRQQWDTDGDGVADESVRYDYDEDGYISTSIARFRGETKIAEERRNINHQSELGIPYMDSIEWDRDGDGVAETTFTDRREDWAENDNVDGSGPDSSKWKSIVQEWAYGEDGEVDEIITFTHGRRIWDRDADGTGDEFCEYYPSENGEVALQCDTDGDQQIDWQVRTDLGCYNVSFDHRFSSILSDAENFRDVTLSSGLAQQRAYRSEFARIFEDAAAVGIYRPEER